jgi:hypothetical protein
MKAYDHNCWLKIVNLSIGVVTQNLAHDQGWGKAKREHVKNQIDCILVKL